ncbi:MAG: TonB family protein [Pseudomonadota bacterium]
MQRVIRLLVIASWAGTGAGAGALLLEAPVQAAPTSPAPASVPAAPAKTKPAAVEPPITMAGPTGDYLRAVHGRLHGRWTENFVKMVAATYPPTHSLNNPSRQVTLALTIRWDGTVAELSVKKSSGSPEFDRAAMDVTRKGAPFPLPTADVVSDDTYAHVEWTFSRDHRACAADARLARVDNPLDISLPHLVMNNKFGEALRRVAESAKDVPSGADVGGGMDRFARLYLGRTTPDPVLNLAASMALVDAGDKAQAGRLRAALGSPATVETAARGLQKMGADVCDSVQQPLSSGTATERNLAMTAVRAVATTGGDISHCAATLSAVVADAGAPKAARLAALEVMLAFIPASAQTAVQGAQQDKDPAVRGAALLASVRKGAGRPEMYRLAPLLHDKQVEIRCAASAGMVRAGGDAALDQLYLLARETDPRPGQAVAIELGRMSTAASAAFLGKMLKKNNLPVQIAAAQALAARRDAAARTELEAAKADDRAPFEVRTIASGRAVPPSLAKAPGQGVAATATAAATSATSATAPLHDLLKQSRNRDAAAWIVEKFTSLDPRDAVDAMGAWLRRQPSSEAAAQGAPPAPASAPQTEAPAPPTASSAALAY